ncbi:MAG: FUSC family protein [Microthrixaceae bacterium]
MEWRPKDPHRVYLHRALRVGITLPVVLALAMRFGSRDGVAYAAFGVVASLSLADFGGPTPRRAGAYATLGAVGLLNIAIGTLCSHHVAAGVAAALVVGFVARFVGVFGGYWAMGTLSALLAFVLAVTTEAGVDELGARLGGWAFGCAAATVAALVLWPRHERHDLQRLAATAARSLAELLRHRSTAGEPHDAAGGTALVTAAQESVDAVRRWLTTTPYRPSGPSAGDRALFDLSMLLSRTRHVVLRVQPPAGDDGSVALLGEAADQLELIAQQLEGHRDPTLTARTRTLSSAREAFVHQVQSWVSGLRQAGPDELQTVDVAFHALLVARLAEELTVCSTVLTDGDAEAVTRAVGQEPERVAWFRGAAQILAPHLTLRSAWCRDSLRTGVGLAAAVGVAMATGLDHGFWIVLGTLSVLRSSARTTSTTALRAVTGTVIGFVLSATLIELSHGSDVVLWILLPILAVGGVYVAGSMNDIIGQAGFTLLVVTLFDIIAPPNWEVGLVRVETVAIGACLSVLVGLLLWPRGAVEVLRSELARYFRSAGALLELSVGAAVTGVSPDRIDGPRSAERRDHARASQAFSEYLGESAVHTVHWDVWAHLLFVPSYTSFACRLISRDLSTGRPSPWPEVADQVTAWGDELATSMAVSGDRLDAPPVRAPGAAAPTDGAAPAPPTTRTVTDDDLARCLGAGSDSPELASDAVALAWARCWAVDLDEVVDAARGPLGVIETTARSSRWSWHRGAAAVPDPIPDAPQPAH